MKRRSFIQVAAAVTGGSLVLPLDAKAGIKKKPLRVGHLSDIHVKPGMIPEKGMINALHHAQSLKPGLDFMINGGDAIMDALEADKQKTEQQWTLFQSILKKENDLGIYHVMGNHDIWGWFIKGQKPDADRLYGKTWAVETLQMPGRYYSFKKANWHFIVLDSTQLNPAGGYIAKLDGLQMEWLKQELRQVPPSVFICIVSHIPILSICSGLFFNKTEQNGDLLIKRNLMHTDFLDLKKLFALHPNIKTCISGHIHLQDQVEYMGIKYYCNGAVSGNWWNGSFQEFAPAYALMEFYDDGSTKRTMINYQ